MSLHRAVALGCLALSTFRFAAAAVPQPPPRLIVLEKTDGTLAIVDPVRLTVSARVPVGPDPHEVVVDADGQRAYVSNYRNADVLHRTLSVVDLATAQPLAAIDLGALSAPHGLDLAGGRIYFTAEGAKAVGRYDPSSARVDWILGTGADRTHLLKVASDGARLYASNVNSNTISIIERAPDADPSEFRQSAIDVGSGPEGFDVSPDGRELWAANSHDGSVSIIDLRTRRVVATLRLNTERSNRLKFTPDGARVLVSDLGNGDLIEIDAATRRELKRARLGRGACGILVAPDSRHAFVALSGEDRVVVVDRANLAVTGRIATGHGPDGMAFAPTPVR